MNGNPTRRSRMRRIGASMTSGLTLIAVARDGALIVTDDGSGTVWRVAYAGAN